MKILYLTKKCFFFVCFILGFTKEHKRQIPGNDMILWKKNNGNQHDPNKIK